MCGPPASGKTTWVNNKIKDLGNGLHISRDEVRFSMITDKDDYFSKEDAVFKEFVRRIQHAIDDGVKNIFVDATHLNEASRKKLFSKLYWDSKRVAVIPVNMRSSKETCLNRNDNRDGLAKVPLSAMRRMYAVFVPANFNEFNNVTYDNIINVWEGGEEF